MVYFPEPVFRNIASYLIDPYKQDKEEHAKVWQKVGVMRYMYTARDGGYHLSYLVHCAEGPSEYSDIFSLETLYISM